MIYAIEEDAAMLSKTPELQEIKERMPERVEDVVETEEIWMF